ncbi:hypothetical protein [Methylococcus capsulatus]|uniref:hypothetical protein n=1 Tax=Methylococcus capsulatus TaxID=414 RepID=UPI0020175D71|nr:hypothetical protein [Methylococcus capsulatus]UQN10954.1 hypothetical protein M3M30_07840 [Methylococcus capsulatus]
MSFDDPEVLEYPWDLSPVDAAPTADGRFYPNFLCQLPGSADRPGVVLAVGHKGADRWNGAEDDRLIGRLWANPSQGRCRFVMVKDER